MINLCALSLSHIGSPQPQPGSSALLQHFLLVGTSLGDSIKSYSWPAAARVLCLQATIQGRIYWGETQIVWPKQGEGVKRGVKLKLPPFCKVNYGKLKRLRSTEVV